MDREAFIREAAEETLLREADERRFLYADVEMMLRTGLLTQSTVVNDTLVIFRTLYPNEHQHLLDRAGRQNALGWMRQHLAASVHMIDGYAVEPQYGSNQAYYLHREWAQDIREEYLMVLYSYVVSLRLRLERAIKILDAFCHERYSRSLWRMDGAPQGQRNIVQRLWVAYNEAEDRWELDQQQWSHTRSIAGAMSGKQAKSLQEAMKKWETQRKDRGSRIIEDAVNWIISGDRAEQEPITVTVNGQTYEVPKVHASQTVEEMEDEMLRAARGEQDYHDVMVEQYKEFHRGRLEDARRAQREAMEAAWGDTEGGLTGETRMVGYTPEQLAEINPNMLKKKPNTQRASVSPEHERFTEYLGTDVKVGWLGAGGVPEEAKKPVPDEGPGSLQDKISRRSPRLKQ